MNNNQIDGLVSQYILWPELNNDFQKNINFEHTSFQEFSKEIEKLPNKRKGIDSQIALFYLANEKLSKARNDSQDVLGLEQLEDYAFYQKTLNQLSKELLAYIIVCSVVETRHNYVFYDLSGDWEDYLQDNGLEDENEEVYDCDTYEDMIHMIKEQPDGQDFLDEYFERYRKKFTKEEDFDKFLNFYLEITQKVSKQFSRYDRDAGYTKIAKTYMPDAFKNYTVGEVLSFLTIGFNNNSFHSGYGGSAWGGIAKHALDFVQGKMNAEMFIDQSFSLEHNGGNMFNKDYLFTEPEDMMISVAKHAWYPNSSHHMGFNVNDLILNSQHLGMVNGLLTLEKQYEKLKDISCDDLYKQLKEEKKLQGMNKTLFKYTYTTISANYQSLIKEMKVIKNDIKKTYPNLVKGNAIAPVDFKKLFLEIAKRKEQEYNLKHINQEQNIFDMWNYLHNEHFSIKKSTKSQTYSFKVYDVDKVPVSAHKPNIIGGKAWGLKNMLNLDIPVPKAKVFTTDCCRAYQKNKELYKTELKAVLPTFKTFLNDENQSPILCSVRSGAPISMPGMMDTVLNVGIDDTNYDYFCEKMGKKVTHNCINKFMTLFCSARLGLEIKFPANLPKGLLKFTEILKEHKIPFNKNKMFPLNVERQIEESLHAVFESWNSPRAQAYRIEKNIDHSIGTAAIVQQMVFGNLNENSYTGVVFSRNCLTGENKLVGEFLPKAQGEDVVSGSVTPFSIDKLKAFNAPIYKQLVTIAKKLENQNGQIQDIEFTVEDGTLYILQHRQAVCSPVAAIKLLKDKNLDSTALLKQIDPNLLQKSVVVDTNELENCSGLSANSGVMRGIVIKKESDMEKYKELYNKHASDKSFGWIFYSQLTSPNHMPIMNKTQAFITEEGGFTSHAAIIARSLNKPCVVGLGKTKDNRFKCGQLLTVDGTSGKIWMGMQPVNETTKLAKTAATILMKSHNIDKEQIDEQMFVERIDRINNDHKSWVLNLSNANHVNKIPVKMDKFLDIGQKFAMILAANQRDVKKLKIA